MYKIVSHVICAKLFRCVFLWQLAIYWCFILFSYDTNWDFFFNFFAEMISLVKFSCCTSCTKWWCEWISKITLVLPAMICISISLLIEFSWTLIICRLGRQKFFYELVKWPSWIHAEQRSLTMLLELFKGRSELILPVNIFLLCAGLPLLYKHYGGVCLLQILKAFSLSEDLKFWRFL